MSPEVELFEGSYVPMFTVLVHAIRPDAKPWMMRNELESVFPHLNPKSVSRRQPHRSSLLSHPKDGCQDANRQSDNGGGPEPTMDQPKLECASEKQPDNVSPRYGRKQCSHQSDKNCPQDETCDVSGSRYQQAKGQ